MISEIIGSKRLSHEEMQKDIEVLNSRDSVFIPANLKGTKGLANLLSYLLETKIIRERA